MPYESFTPSRAVEITDVVLDEATNAWMYHIRVFRGSRDEADSGFCHEYEVRRRFSEFKRLHNVLAPIMGNKLTPLPADGLVTMLMSGNEELLNTRKKILEQILVDAMHHAGTRELPEVLAFLGFDSSCAKLMPPVLNNGATCSPSTSWTRSPKSTTMVSS